MTRSVTTIMYMGFSGFIFMMALTYALSSITANQDQFEVSPGTEGSVYTKATAIPEEVLFSGFEVMSSLYKLNFEDGITVKVDHLTFSTAKDIKEKIPLISKYAKYSQSFDFSTDGSISTITYVSE